MALDPFGKDKITTYIEIYSPSGSFVESGGESVSGVS